MGVFAGPRCIDDGLVLSLDSGNNKSWTGSGTTWFDITNNNDAPLYSGGTTISEYADPVAGTVFDLDNTNQLFQVTFASGINEYTWSIIYWLKYKGTPSSNYQLIWQLHAEVQNNSGYYFNCDSRTTASPHILQYVKDIAISSWDTRTVVSNADWVGSDKWFCCGLSMHAEDDWRSYREGKLIGSNSATNQDISGISNVDELRIGDPDGPGAYMGNVMFYNRALSANEMNQNFQALRSRYGL
jgi:hypothetical protein